MRQCLLILALLAFWCVPAWGQTATPTHTPTRTPTVTPTPTNTPSPTFRVVRAPTPAFGAGNQYWTARGRCAEVITASNAWLDLCTIETLGYRVRQVTFSARTNDISVRVLCSVDGGLTYPVVSTAATTVTAESSVADVSTWACTHVKLQAQPAGAGANGVIFAQWWEQSY